MVPVALKGCGRESANAVPLASPSIDFSCAQTQSYKGLGLRALAPIATGQLISEYVGEVIDQEEFESRMTEYRVRGPTWLR